MRGMTMSNPAAPCTPSRWKPSRGPRAADGGACLHRSRSPVAPCVMCRAQPESTRSAQEGAVPSPPNQNSSQASTAASASGALSEEYTETMQARMGSASLVYCHEDGMNYTRILDNLIVGSCPQTAEDIERLVSQEEVGTILSLQEDSDMAYFGLDLAPILAACSGRIDHVRRPLRDFDAHSLRMGLPAAVAALQGSMQRQGGTAYIHCTAGLGRAPAVALAYMWWVCGVTLPHAHAHLTALRPCSPKLGAVRAAALDVLQGRKARRTVLCLAAPATCRRVQAAGLDVGWGNRVGLTRRGRGWELRRELPPGAYPYKFVVEGRWTLSPAHPTMLDGASTNNVLHIEGWEATPEEEAASARILDAQGDLTAEEAERIRAALRAEEAAR
uniref:Tyrosine specific protein phosphatases domain-containing protein n=1 Tax=Auxenochlorella protothecoides TaxID=3075 RepID=A0A1D1ZZI8_AUXPR